MHLICIIQWISLGQTICSTLQWLNTMRIVPNRWTVNSWLDWMMIICKLRRPTSISWPYSEILGGRSSHVCLIFLREQRSRQFYVHKFSEYFFKPKVTQIETCSAQMSFTSGVCRCDLDRTLVICFPVTIEGQKSKQHKPDVNSTNAMLCYAMLWELPLIALKFSK